MIEIREIQDALEWERLMKKQEFSLFTQSSMYSRVSKAMGDTVWIFGIFDEGHLLGGSVVVGVRAKRGSYLMLQYGPVCAPGKTEQFLMFMKFLVDFAKRESYDFIRSTPFLDDTPEHRRLYRDAGFKNAPIHMLAEHTWLLDLSQSESNIISHMKKNHRNLIRRCQREGVQVRITKDTDALKRLNEMHTVVAKRHGFRRFSEKFISEEFNVLSQADQACIFEARLADGRVDASAVIIFYGSMACYRHSASLNLERHMPGSYLIQWHAIQEAQRRGMKWYNFWGIAPDSAGPDHPFAGITHFKKGFGGFQKNLVPNQDYPIRARYALNWMIETVRSVNRGFNQ